MTHNQHLLHPKDTSLVLRTKSSILDKKCTIHKGASHCSTQFRILCM